MIKEVKAMGGSDQIFDTVLKVDFSVMEDDGEKGLEKWWHKQMGSAIRWPLYL